MVRVVSFSRRYGRLIRVLGCFAALALLSACATHGPSPLQEAATYKAHAKRNYKPPGPPEDPWGPYIVEAATRFDVPDRWVRQVMHVESGGKLYQGGDLITSWAGAMGLMQVMPDTYDGLRERYALGDDPFDPHDNILAGTAYIREMYDLYGFPGFLAAYNAGPKRLDDYLSHNRSLPDETRHYVAKIAPYIADVRPVNRSPAEQLAMNALPMDIPPGPRYARARTRAAAQYAQAHGGVQVRDRNGRRITVPVQMAQRQPSRNAPPAQDYADAAPPPPPNRRGFHLMQTALADTLPARHGGPEGGQWAIQVGAFGNPQQARVAAGTARDRTGVGAAAHTTVTSVRSGGGTLYRARIGGLSRDAAMQACGRIGRGKGCMVLSPDAQS